MLEVLKVNLSLCRGALGSLLSFSGLLRGQMDSVLRLGWKTIELCNQCSEGLGTVKKQGDRQQRPWQQFGARQSVHLCLSRLGSFSAKGKRCSFKELQW